jgi:Tfp pilus assembly protein PilX
LFNLLEAALRAAEEIARTLNDPTAQAKYHELFARSQASYTAVRMKLLSVCAQPSTIFVSTTSTGVTTGGEAQ